MATWTLILLAIVVAVFILLSVLEKKKSSSSEKDHSDDDPFKKKPKANDKFAEQQPVKSHIHRSEITSDIHDDMWNFSYHTWGAIVSFASIILWLFKKFLDVMKAFIGWYRKPDKKPRKN